MSAPVADPRTSSLIRSRRLARSSSALILAKARHLSVLLALARRLWEVLASRLRAAQCLSARRRAGVVRSRCKMALACAVASCWSNVSLISKLDETTDATILGSILTSASVSPSKTQPYGLAPASLVPGMGTKRGSAISAAAVAAVAGPLPPTAGGGGGRSDSEGGGGGSPRGGGAVERSASLLSCGKRGGGRGGPGAAHWCARERLLADARSR